MNEPSARYAVRPMALMDVEQVSRIDRAAFPTVWPPIAFRDELTKNKVARYLVACEGTSNAADALAASAAVPPAQHPTALHASSPGPGRWIERFKRPLVRRASADPGPHDTIVGFVGIWLVIDESHITSIAVDETRRRRGVGELLLLSSLDLGLKSGARIATLEVRASNTPAQVLYERYGFKQAGVRPRYYTDNNEDAYIMTTEPMTTPAYQRSYERLKERYFGSHATTRDAIVLEAR